MAVRIQTDQAANADEVRRLWGERLLIERRRQRLTQAELAQRAAVGQKVVFSVENGRGSLQSFLTVATALGVDLFREAS